MVKISSINRGLVGHWRLDAETGATDLSPYSNNGTANGGLSFGSATDQHAQANRATTFDGVNQYVNIPDNASLQNVNDMTISAWIKLNNTTGYKWIVCKNYFNEYCFGTIASELRFYNGDGGYEAGDSSGANISTSWTYVTVVRTSSGKNVDFYVNGAYISSWNYTKTITASSGNVYIGTRNDFYTYFNGSIDDVRIYNRALSQTEITQLYQSYRPKLVINK